MKQSLSVDFHNPPPESPSHFPTTPLSAEQIPSTSEPLSLDLIKKLLHICNLNDAIKLEHGITYHAAKNLIIFNSRAFHLKSIKDIGCGQFGHVQLYKIIEMKDEAAIHTLDVAIKYLAYEDQADTFSELRKHLSISAVISDSHLVPAIGQLPFIDAIVMPYYEEGSLADWKTKHQYAPLGFRLPHIQSMINQIISALHDLHTNKQPLIAFCKDAYDDSLKNADGPLIHGDLKLKNIFIDSDLNAYLGDLGCVETIDRLKQTGKLENGTFYMHAPEVMLMSDLSEYTTTACIKLDVWSLGIIIKELLDQIKPNDEPVQLCDTDRVLSTIDRHTIFNEWAINYESTYMDYLAKDRDMVTPHPLWESLNALANCCLAPAPHRPTTIDLISQDRNHWIKYQSSILSASSSQASSQPTPLTSTRSYLLFKTAKQRTPGTAPPPKKLSSTS